MKTQIFQMVGSTRSTPNGFGDSSGRNQSPPPPDMTFISTQNGMLLQILLHMQQQQQQQPHGNRIDAQSQVTEYKHFLDMNPPQFTEEEEPHDPDAWIRAIEAMLRCLPCHVQKDARLNLRHCSFVVLP
jgi:hypothetical protein